MTLFLQLRLLGIFLTAGATLAVLGRTLLVPLPIERPPKPVVLPSASPLPDWESVPDPAPNPDLPATVRFRRAYGEAKVDLEVQYIANLPVHYIRNPLLELRFLPRGHLPLDAGMNFYVNSRNRVIANRRNDAPTDAEIDPRQSSPQSGYAFWTMNRWLHLSTVITPDGDTAMDTQVVSRQLYLDHLSLRRIAQWLLGRRVLPDRRCVLVHFSVPEDAPESQILLEMAWKECQQGYPVVFPE